MRGWPKLLLLLLGALALAAVMIPLGWRWLNSPGSQTLLRWWRGDEEVRQSLMTVQREACPGAPFVLPSDGFIGLLYGDPGGPYSEDRPHQGIDIFSDGQPGVTPVYAAYDGYITREPSWKSTLIQRVPQDPLNPERQIWLYYTHMADESGENDFIESAFPPGTRELFVEQGTLLGYTGDYSGSAVRSVWTHLHFSIVLDNGEGNYLNELVFENTIDPSPYLGMELGFAGRRDLPIECHKEAADEPAQTSSFR